MFSNRYLDALAKSIFVFGLVHIVVQLVAALRGRAAALNVFTILGFDSLMPALGQGVFYFILSYAFTLLVYALVFLFLTKPKPRSKS